MSSAIDPLESLRTAPATDPLEELRTTARVDPLKQLEIHRSPMGQFFQYLGFAPHMAAGALDAALQGRDVLQGMEMGFHNDTTFGQVLKKQGMAGPLAGVLGFGLDVATDPLSYTGIGSLSAAGKLAKTAKITGELASLEGLPAALNAGKAFLPTARGRALAGQQSLVSLFGHSVTPRRLSAVVLGGTEDVVGALKQSGFGQAFTTALRSPSRAAPEALRVTAGALKSQIAMQSRQVIGPLSAAQKIVQDVARSTGTPQDVAKSLISNAIERAPVTGVSPEVALLKTKAAIQQGRARWGAPETLDPAIREAVNTINALNAHALANEQAAGIKIGELAGGMGYLHRAATPELMDAVRRANPGFKGSPREFSDFLGAAIKRTHPDKTLEEVNDLAAAGELAITGGRKVKEAFFSDPFVATALRMQESTRAIATRQFLEASIRTYGREAPAEARGLAELSRQGWRPLADATVKDLELGGKNLLLPKNVADLLDHHFEKVISPAYVQPFLRAYDRMQGNWKLLTLPIWPAYHTRNMLSDAWMMTAGPDGMPLWRLPVRGTQSAQALRGGTGTLTLGRKSYTHSELRDVAEHWGVIDGGIQRDMDELIHQPLKGGKALEDWAPVKLGMAVGRTRENAGRMAFFIDRLARGEHPGVAALEVKKRLFDYSELSDFEKQTLRRVIPFYSWMRNNLPLQISWALRHPGYGALQTKVQKEIQTATSTTPYNGPMPEFLSQGLPAQMGQDRAGNPLFGRLQGLLPSGDLAQLGSPVQTLLNSLSPMLQAPAESALNTDIFRQRPLENYPGETQPFLGARIPGRMMPFLQTMRPLTEANRLTQPSDVSPGNRIAQLMLMRTYAVDPSKEHQGAAQKKAREVRDLQARMHSAARHNDQAKVREIQRRILKVLAQ